MKNELTEKVFVRELKKYFNLTQLSGDDNSLDRWIIVPDVNRPGLELSGYIREHDLKRVNIIGNKEIDYIQSMDFETQKSRFGAITDSYTPCIILTDNVEAPASLLEIATSKNFPVFATNETTYQFIVDIISYLDEQLAKTEVLHGVLLQIYGFGVLIQGKSGIGKSELALELVKNGHSLVCDDAVEVKRVHNEIVGFAPKLIKHYLELRGIGVVDISKMFGAQAVIERTNINMIINLISNFDDHDIDRVLETEYKKVSILSKDIECVDIPVTEGRSLGSLVEAAVINYKLRKQGVNSAEQFQTEVRDEILRKN